MLLMDENYWITEYEEREALWMHDGNPRRPHALLTSGLHSNGFFFSKPVTDNPELCQKAAMTLAGKFSQANDITKVNRVVGPKSGATKLAEAIHLSINLLGGNCTWSSPKKVGDSRDRKMVFETEEEKPKPGEFVLLCEDVLTTGGSIRQTIEAVSAENAACLPYVLMLVNRSGLDEIERKHIIPLISQHMPTWTAEECPLCKQGSKAIRPKDPKENWGRLNATY